MLTALACQEAGEIGLTPTTPVGVFLSDTFSIRRSTLLLDSVQSNGLSGLLVGRFVDPIFGKGRATSFARLSLASQFVQLDADRNTIPASKMVYDSTKIRVGYGVAAGDYYFGDTTVTQTLTIHRLTENVGTANYDIRNAVAYEPQPVARFTFQPRPFTSDSLSFSAFLPDAIGRELFALYDTEAGKDATKFQDLNTKGFALVSTTSTERAALLRYAKGSYVEVFYHVTGETVARSHAFYLNGPGFTNFVVDRTGTPLAGLKAGQILPSTATNGRTYVQPFSGVTTKLEFPTLLSLEQNRRVAINRAELIITPAQPEATAPNGANTLPYYIALSEINGFQLARTTPNRIVQMVPSFIPGTSSTSPVNRNESSFYYPQIAFFEPRSKSYTVNMTAYIQSMIAGTTPNNGLVILTPGSSNITPSNANTGVLSAASQQLYLNDRVQRMILDGNASVKLVLFYTASN